MSGENASTGKCPVDHTDPSKSKKSRSPFSSNLHPVAGLTAGPDPTTSSSSSTSSSTSSTTTTDLPPVSNGTPSTSSTSSTSSAPSATVLTNQPPAECPVKHTSGDNKTGEGNKRKVYNVYGQLIDPTNNMPAKANQEPAPGQRIPLSKDRVKSNIPKGGTDADTWLYPSPQMFFNALRRKGKDDGFREEDADVVVAIHNNMNERTWNKVMEWESRFCNECPDPKLLKFMGRPDELSPKARMKTWLGWIIPFDRHDWYIDRCGKEVRYVIDYYYDESKSSQDQLPALKSTDSIKSIHVDVRPALDSFGSFVERLRMALPRFQESYNAGYNSTFSEKTQAAARELKAAELSQLRSQLELIQQRCEKRHLEVQNCKGEEACEKAMMGLSYCMGQVVCKEQADKFMDSLQTSNNPEQVQALFADMSECLRLFGLKAGRDFRANA